MSEKTSFKELLAKTTTANIAATIIVVGGLIYGIIFKDAEIVKSLTLFGAGYLFGRSAVK